MVSVHGSISVYIGFGQLDSILATIFRWLCIAALTTRIYILPLNRYYNGMVLSSLSLSPSPPFSLSLRLEYDVSVTLLALPEVWKPSIVSYY